MLFALLKSGMNHSTAGVNSWLTSHPFRFPPTMATLLPNPYVGIQQQQQCCASWHHGFIDLEGFERTKESPHALSPQLALASSKRALMRMRKRRGQVEAASVRMPTVLSGSASDGDGGSVADVNIGSDQSITVIVYSSFTPNRNNINCELGAVGDRAVGTPALPTDGDCLFWPGGEGQSYRMVASGASVRSFVLSNDPDCTTSVVNVSNATLGRCASAGTASVAFVRTNAVPDPGAATVRRGSGTNVSGTLEVWASPRCDGGEGFAFTSLGPTACALMPATNTSYSLVLSPGGGTISGKFLCDASCENCSVSAEADRGTGASDCVSAHGQSLRLFFPTGIPSLNPNPPVWPLAVGVSVGAVLSIVFAVLAWKGRLSWVVPCVKSMLTSSRGACNSCGASLWSSCGRCAENTNSGAMKGCSAARSGMASFVGCCRTVCSSATSGCAACLTATNETVRRSIRRFARWLRGTHVWNFRKTMKMDLLRHNYLYGGWELVDTGACESHGVVARKNFVSLPSPAPEYSTNPDLVHKTTCVLCGITAGATVIHAVLWAYRSPFDIFTETMLQKIGLSGKYLSSSIVVGHFEAWSRYGNAAVITNAALLGIGGVNYTFGRRRYRMVNILLTAALVCHFGALLLPPLVFRFGDGFVLQANNTADDSTLASSLEYDIGAGFASVAITWFATLFTFAMSAIPFAVFLGASIFSVQQSHHGGAEMQLEEGRIYTMIWLAHLICPLATLLGVILLYQSASGTPAASGIWWPLLWLALWILPPAVVSSWGRVFPRKTKNAPGYVHAPTSTWVKCVYCGVYSAIVAGCLGGLFFGEFQFIHGIDATFLATTTITTVALLITAVYTGLQGERFRDILLLQILRPPEELESMASGVNAEADSDETESRQRHLRYTDLDDVPMPGTNEDTPLIDGEPGRFSAGIASRCLYSVIAFISESTEQRYHGRYGKRLPWRRLCLIIGLSCMGVYLAHVGYEDTHETAFQEFKGLLDKMGVDVDWPSNGTMFDSAFETYQQSRAMSDTILFSGWLVAVSALFVESPINAWIGRGWGLPVSQALVAISLVIMFAGVIYPATPNYLSEADLKHAIPECAPQFNAFLESLVRNLLGLAIAALFTGNTFVLLLAIAPAICRIATRILEDPGFARSVAEPGEAPISPAVEHVHRRNVALIFWWGAAIPPLLVCLPLVVFYQVEGDNVLSICIASFGVAPVIVGYFTTPPKVGWFYLAFLVAYFMPLIVMVLHLSTKEHLGGEIVHALKDPMTYLEIASEIAFANVIVSDIIYRCLFPGASRGGKGRSSHYVS